MIKIKRAIISVYDKTELEGLLRMLFREGIEILSTGGTKKYISELNIPVQDISEYTEFPEILNGRVKTLHPLIYGGILFKRDVKEHKNTIRSHSIKPVDLVIVNLYPFEEVIKAPDVTEEKAIENIDIGGVTLLRAAAKNFRDVVVISGKKQYSQFIKEFNQNDGRIPRKLSAEFAAEAFSNTSWYDSLISNYYAGLHREVKESNEVSLQESIPSNLIKVDELRYGENPHQNAALYREPDIKNNFPVQIHGKKLSYNNMVDIDAAFRLVYEFRSHKCAAFIKHTNPCGIALSESALSDAYLKARECDPISFFGGIVALSKAPDETTADLITESFLEAVIAPSFTQTALEILQKKKNLRLIEFNSHEFKKSIIMKSTIFGTVAQEEDFTDEEEILANKTEIDDLPQDSETMKFGIKVCKHVKSNAIVLVKNMATVGIGAGQMSRIDALKIALEKAGGRAADSIMISDAFFPFPDCVKLASEAGISAIVQPGGSIKDKDSIDAATEAGIPMFLTGVRHFKH